MRKQEGILKESCEVHHVASLYFPRHIRVVHHVHVSVTQGADPRHFAQKDVIDLRGRIVPPKGIDAGVNE